MAMPKSAGLTLLCLRHLVMLVVVSVSTVYTTLLVASARSVNHCTFRILPRTSGIQILAFVSIVPNSSDNALVEGEKFSACG